MLLKIAKNVPFGGVTKGAKTFLRKKIIFQVFTKNRFFRPQNGFLAIKSVFFIRI